MFRSQLYDVKEIAVRQNEEQPLLFEPCKGNWDLFLEFDFSNELPELVILNLNDIIIRGSKDYARVIRQQWQSDFFLIVAIQYFSQLLVLKFLLLWNIADGLFFPN